MTQKVERLNCQHIDSGARAALKIPAGDYRMLLVCHSCAEQITGIVLQGVIERAVQKELSSSIRLAKYEPVR